MSSTASGQTLSQPFSGAGSERRHVVTILPRGEAIRNFVYSGALEKLAEAAEITVLSVIPSEDLRRVLSSGPFSLHPLNAHRDRWPVRISRDLLDLSHGRHLWSKAAQERWMLRDHEAARSFPERARRIGKKLLCYPFANAAGLDALSWFERSISRWLNTTDEFLNLYRTIRPDLVFNASHVHSRNAVQAVEAAQWLGIPTATFIFSWDNLTSQGRILPAYDYYLVWNEDIRGQLLRIYPRVRPEQIIVTGTPQFDFHFRPEYHQSREDFCHLTGADPARPIILYSTGMPNHMPGEELIVEGIADMLAGMEEAPQLLVRVYPKDLSGRFDALKRRRPDILFPSIPWEPAWLTPKPEDLSLLTSTLRHCSLGINIASTISLELCMFDKPVINIAYDPPGLDITPLSFARYYHFDHYAPIVASRAVDVARSPDAARAMIAAALRNPAARAAERRRLMESFFGNTLDGRCAARAADALLAIAARAAGGRHP